MRRASRLAIQPGEHVITSEFRAVLGASHQNRWRSSDVSQVKSSRSPKKEGFSVLNATPRLSLSSILRFGPAHHAESQVRHQRMLEQWKKHRPPNRARPAPNIAQRRPRGDGLDVIGSTVPQALAASSDISRPDLHQVQRTDPVENHAVSPDVSHTFGRSRTLADSLTGQAESSDPSREHQILQSTSTSAATELNEPVASSPAEPLQVSSDASNEATCVPAVQASFNTASAIEEAPAVQASFSTASTEAPDSGAVDTDSIHQYAAKVAWPHVSSLVHESVERQQAVAHEPPVESVLQAEQAAVAVDEPRFPTDLSSAPQQADTHGRSSRPNVLSTSGVVAADAEQSPLLRVKAPPVDVPADVMHMEAQKVDHEASVLLETQAKEAVPVARESPVAATPAATTSVEAPVPEQVIANATTDEPVVKIRLQDLQNAAPAVSPLLRKSAPIEIAPFVVESATLPLKDQPQASAAATGVWQWLQQSSRMQVSPAAPARQVSRPPTADTLPSDQASIDASAAEMPLPSTGSVQPSSAAPPRAPRSTQLQNEDVLLGESAEALGGKLLNSSTSAADTSGARVSLLNATRTVSKLLQTHPSKDTEQRKFDIAQVGNLPLMKTSSGLQTKKTAVSKADVSSFGPLASSRAAKQPKVDPLLTLARRQAASPPVVAKMARKSMLQYARTELGPQHTSTLLGSVAAPQATSGALADSVAAVAATEAAATEAPSRSLLQQQPEAIEDLPLQRNTVSTEEEAALDQHKLDLSQLGQTSSTLLNSRELPSFLKDGATPRPSSRAPSTGWNDRQGSSREPRSHSEQRFQHPRGPRDRSFQEPQHYQARGEVGPADTQLSAMEMFKKMVDASSKGNAHAIKNQHRGQRYKQHQQQYQQRPKQVAAVQSVVISDTMTVRDLARALDITPAVLDGKMIDLGEIVESEEDIVSTDAAELVALDMGFECTIQTSQSGTDVRPRPPVVTIVGHVDHGKTTLLDCLRNSHVAEGEAGGITQHVGAFSVTMPDTSAKITFLDTPGHAAFSAMRARGTRVTDVAVLVVAADDGVMQTTREAIQHVRDANCSLIVALTKCDRPGARPTAIEGELMGEGLELESAGGNVQVVHVAAPKGIGLRELEEAILLQAELLGVSAPVDTLPEASVVESHVDRGQGPVATVVVRQGVLKVGQPVVVGKEHGRVRSLHDPEGAAMQEATPGQPVVVSGLKGVPHAGDMLRATSSESRARDIAEARAARAQTRHHAALEKLSKDHFDTVVDEATGTSKQVLKPSVPLMLHADVDGSLEALTTSLLAVNTGRIVYKVVTAAVGPPSSRDVQMALDTGASIVCFGVSMPTLVQRDADMRGVSVVQSNVIYKLLDTLSMKLVASAPKMEERVTTGEVEVAATFHASVKKSISATGKVKIAGCKVVDGRVRRDAVLVRVKRVGVVVWEGKIRELKQSKNNVDQVGKGSECGIMLSGWEDFQVGDKLEILEMQAAKPKLSSTASGAVRIEG